MPRIYGFPVDSARLKYDRAIKHIGELDSLLATFKASEPYRIGPLYKPDQPQLTHYYLAKASPIPDDVALISGDILQNLRSTLDHLAGQLIYAAGNTPDRNTAFPVSDCASKYEAESERKVKLMRQDAINAIRSVEPYQRGRGEALWRLHRLNNIDKHNLIFTTASAVLAIDALGHWAKTIPQLKPLAESGYVFIPDKRCPLQEGDILFTTLRQEVDDNLKFAIDIAFNEPEICECEPVLITVKSLADVVDKLLKDFAPLLYFDI